MPSKAWVWGRSLDGIVVSKPAWIVDVFSLLRVVFFQVEGSAAGRSLVQRSPTECGVSECDFETITTWRLDTNGAVAPRKMIQLLIVIIRKPVLSY
jgi:hypothetical protein